MIDPKAVVVRLYDRVVGRLTRDMSQVEQMYRRLVFNVAIGNRDDHAKNFSFMMDTTGRWSLTPAYDLLPSSGFNGGSGRPTNDDMLAVGVRAGLATRLAKGIITEISREVGERS